MTGQTGDAVGGAVRVGAQRYPDWLVAAVLVAAYAVLVGAPLVGGVPPLVGAVALTVLFTLAALAVAALAARLELSPGVELLGMLLGVLNWFLFAAIGGMSDFARLAAVPIADVLLLFAMVLGGRLVSRIVRDRKLIVPVALVVALADVFTVSVGPTGAALEKMPRLVEAVSVKLPAVGSAVGPEGVAGLRHIRTVGPGDFFFAALFFAIAVRFGLSLPRSFWWVFGIVGAGLALVVAVPTAPPIPMLPLVAVGFLIPNWGSLRLTRAEWGYLIIGFAFLMVLFSGLKLMVDAALR